MSGIQAIDRQQVAAGSMTPDEAVSLAARSALAWLDTPAAHDGSWSELVEMAQERLSGAADAAETGRSRDEIERVDAWIEVYQAAAYALMALAQISAETKLTQADLEPRLG